ncbi:MAG: hypothetical protein WDO24_09860 [Pseudomonadota bacterium]
MVPSVAMKGLTLRRVTVSPLISPTSALAAIPAITPTAMLV